MSPSVTRLQLSRKHARPWYITRLENDFTTRCHQATEYNGESISHNLVRYVHAVSCLSLSLSLSCSRYHKILFTRRDFQTITSPQSWWFHPLMSLGVIVWNDARREFLREILYKNITIIAIQHVKFILLTSLAIFPILLGEIHSSRSGKFPYIY